MTASLNARNVIAALVGAGLLLLPLYTSMSGNVFARFVMPEDWIGLASLPAASVSAASVQSTTPDTSATVFTMRSFGQKVRAWLNGYRLGYWPAEKGRLRSEAYKNPDGFIEVTPANEDTRVSEHFRLRDFVSHDQKEIWPKYVVLREATMSVEESMQRAPELLARAAENVVRGCPSTS